MSEPKTVRVTAKRDFKDAGTEQNFTAGEAYELPEGVATNYRFAGLVEDVPAEAAEPAVDAKKRS